MCWFGITFIWPMRFCIVIGFHNFFVLFPSPFFKVFLFWWFWCFWGSRVSFYAVPVTLPWVGKFVPDAYFSTPAWFLTGGRRGPNLSMRRPVQQEFWLLVFSFVCLIVFLGFYYYYYYYYYYLIIIIIIIITIILLLFYYIIIFFFKVYFCITL